MPYLNLSYKEYYSITCTFFLLITLVSQIFGPSSRDAAKGFVLRSIDSVTGALIPTAIIYLCGGHFYYLATT
jgi:hypothetical protein